MISIKQGSGKPDEQRLAAALKENLKRRKAQARAKGEKDTAAPRELPATQGAGVPHSQKSALKRS